jgi:hypothetical protein
MKKLGTTVIPIQTIDSPLKFEFRISNIKGKNLPENKVKLLIIKSIQVLYSEDNF